MLPELLSEKSQAESASNLGDHPERNRPYNVFRKHFRGDSSNQGARNGAPVYWEHAEDFLDFVDTATRGNEARRGILYKALDDKPIGNLYDRCVHAVAAECEITSLIDVSKPEVTPEIWQPYVKWAQRVRASDSVITFNYDTVLEKLGEAPSTGALGKETVFGVQGSMDAAEGIALIYKMHGSIDWVRTGENEGPILRLDPVSIIGGSKPPLMATPGPTKRLHCADAFQHIWTKALDALKRAEVVVFVGYRFPPSDAESRGKLLAALRDNVSGKGVRVHTVLGPNTGEGDTIRLRELLRSSLSEKLVEQTDTREVPKNGHFQVIVHPLYAEDFFTVFHDNMLFGHGTS